MEKRLCCLTQGGEAVVTRIKKAPRLQALGLAPGTVVRCMYKSSFVMVLEVGQRLLALRIGELRRVWADY